MNDEPKQPEFGPSWLLVIFAAVIMLPSFRTERAVMLSLLVIPLALGIVLLHFRDCLRAGKELRAVFVLLIVGLLVAECLAFHFPAKLLSPQEKSKPGATMGDISAMNSALALYQVDVECKQFPATTLMQLYSDNAAGWAGPYMATITPDPWGNAYTYTSDGTNYTLQSVHDSDYNKSETIRYIAAGGKMESLPM